MVRPNRMVKQIERFPMENEIPDWDLNENVVFYLYHQQGMQQVDVAKATEISQPTIHRILKSAEKKAARHIFGEPDPSNI